MTALAAKCDIYSPLPFTSGFEINLHLWKSFEKTIVNWSMYYDFIYCVMFYSF